MPSRWRTARASVHSGSRWCSVFCGLIVALVEAGWSCGSSDCLLALLLRCRSVSGFCARRFLCCAVLFLCREDCVAAIAVEGVPDESTDSDRCGLFVPPVLRHSAGISSSDGVWRAVSPQTVRRPPLSSGKQLPSWCSGIVVGAHESGVFW
ncbi:hypothetical protein TcG_09103 [Trypanosoma cruzi]|nr:hypothetical protein TcG_09103 [Trypanosoma cruzi]